MSAPRLCAKCNEPIPPKKKRRDTIRCSKGCNSAAYRERLKEAAAQALPASPAAPAAQLAAPQVDPSAPRALLPAPTPAAPPLCRCRLRDQVLARLQALRDAAGQPPLRVLSALTELANLQATEMALWKWQPRPSPPPPASAQPPGPGPAPAPRAPASAPGAAAPDKTPSRPETSATQKMDRLFPGMAAFSMTSPAESLDSLLAKLQPSDEPVLEQPFEFIGVGISQVDDGPIAITLLLWARPRRPRPAGPGVAG